MRSLRATALLTALVLAALLVSGPGAPAGQERERPEPVAHPAEAVCPDPPAGSVDAHLGGGGAEVRGGCTDPWWDYNWSYRMKLSFMNSGQFQTFYDFPVLVRLNSSNLDYSRAKDDGGDLRFVDIDGATLLDHHIELWDVSGNSSIWVNATHIAGSSSGDYMLMYYGNPSASDVQDPAGTYEQDFACVWHLNETVTDEQAAATHLDSTANAMQADQNGNDDAPGKMGRAQKFDGADDHLRLPASDTIISAASPWTAELWYRLAGALDIPADQRILALKRPGSGNAFIIELDAAAQDQLKLAYHNGSVFHSIFIDSLANLSHGWHHVAVSYDGSTFRTYLDGQPDVSAVDTFSGFGNGGGSVGTNIDLLNKCLDGVVDEIRISRTVRSPGWIKAQYMSMNGSFLLFGDEQGHQPPYVAKRIPDLVIPEDGREDSINLSGVFADDDTAGLMFSCDDPGPFDVNISALGAVAIVPPPDWHGTRPITLSAEDEFSKAWVVFNLTVTPVDDPPVLEPIDDLHGDQGEPIFIQAVGNDSRDGEDILFYDNTSLFDIDPVSGDATLVPHNHDVGSHPVSVRVVDENGSAAFANFTIEVNNVNDPPEILSLGGTNTSGGGSGPGSILDPVVLGAVEDVRTNWTVVYSDIDETGAGCDEELEFTFHTGDPWVDVAFDPVADNFSCLPGQSDIDRLDGVLTGWLKLTDAGGLEDVVYFRMELGEVNEPPTRPDFTWVITGERENPGHEPGYDVAFTGIPSTDEEGDAMTYAWDFGEGGMYEDPGDLAVAVTFPSAGTHHVTLSVRDEAGNGAGRTRLVIIPGHFPGPEPDEDDGEAQGDGSPLEDIDGEAWNWTDRPVETSIDHVTDHDGDGMPDFYEIIHGFDPFDPADAAGDDDRDGYTNLEEYLKGTDPWVWDEGGGGEGNEHPDANEWSGDGGEPGEGDGSRWSGVLTVSNVSVVLVLLAVIGWAATAVIMLSRKQKVRRWNERKEAGLEGGSERNPVHYMTLAGSSGERPRTPGSAVPSPHYVTVVRPADVGLLGLGLAGRPTGAGPARLTGGPETAGSPGGEGEGPPTGSRLLLPAFSGEPGGSDPPRAVPLALSPLSSLTPDLPVARCAGDGGHVEPTEDDGGVER